MLVNWQDKLAVWYEGLGDIERHQRLADRLTLTLLEKTENPQKNSSSYLLTWRDDRLMLLDANAPKQTGQFVDIEHRPGEQLSWPTAKKGAFAQALGKKTKMVVDATAGWGQDSLAMFRMGYDVMCIERSPVMASLLQDGFDRLSKQDWVQRLGLSVPSIKIGCAIELLDGLTFIPDCVFLDPMFPPKRKKSALAKKGMTVLRNLVGDDEDKEKLLKAALKITGKRVVVKSPDHAEPLGGKPDESFQGKLLRYDVYFKTVSEDQ